MSSSPRTRQVLAVALASVVAVPVAVLLPRARAAFRGLPQALGASTRTVLRSLPSDSAAPADEQRYESDHHSGRSFHNRQRSHTVTPADVPRLLRSFRGRGPVGSPIGPVQVVTPEIRDRTDGLAVTWLGHASALVEIDGTRILFDPVVESRVSPSAQIGPRRLHRAPLTAAELPAVDAVVISHDHYDHLESSTIRDLAQRTACRFIVPLGIGSHLRRWGVPVDRIDELDWDAAVRVGAVTLACTEARHFSGRFVRRDATLWSSWAVAGPRHRVFFGGDTGYTPSFGRTGALFGPFDLTILPIGAYHPAWQDIHMNPEEALRAHGDLGGTALLPIHWATFDLALHSWDEPIERLLRGAAESPEATGRGPVVIGTPRPGQRWDLTGDVPRDDWWRAVAPAGGAHSWPSAITDPADDTARPGR